MQRARIVLPASAGSYNKTISQELGLGEETVGFWRKRWVDNGAELEKFTGKPKPLRATISHVLADQPRPGSPGLFSAEQVCHLLAVAGETPPEHLSHWTRPERARTLLNRGIVETISASSGGRFLKPGGFKTSPN